MCVALRLATGCWTTAVVRVEQRKAKRVLLRDGEKEPLTDQEKDKVCKGKCL